MAVTTIQASPRRFALSSSPAGKGAAPRLLDAARLGASVMAVTLMSLTLGLGLYAMAHEGRVYEGVAVAGVDLGGMTRAEARDAVATGFASYMNGPLELAHAGQRFGITPVEAGMAIDRDATVARAMAFGRGGSVWSRSQRWAKGLLRGVDMAAVVRVDEGKADATLRSLTPDVAVAPIDARLDMTTDEPTLVTEVAGVGLDIGVTKGQIAQRVAERSTEPVVVATVPVAAEVTAATLAPALTTARGAVDTAMTIIGVDGRAWAIGEAQLRTVGRLDAAGAVTVDAESVRLVVKGLAREMNRDAVDARLIVDDASSLRVIPSERSVAVEVQTSTDAIVAGLLRGDDTVALSVDRRASRISDAEAEAGRVAAEAMIAAGVTVVWDGGELRLGRDDLAAALEVVADPEADEPFTWSLSPEALADRLRPVAEEIDRPGSEPKLRYVDGEIRVHQRGQAGSVVDVVGSVERIVNAVTAGHATTRLEIVDQTPTVDAEAIARISLADELGMSSTYYGTSSEPRRQNVERAVELETGWLVAPGETFSYVEHIGAVDEENEFVTGLGIIADGAGGVTTAPVIGGGICQVSTTIFQAAYWAGLEIVERTPHPYWLPSYGEPPTGMKGLDAMVNVETDPNAAAITLDMVFRNSTEDWIAVVLTADGENVTTRIMGTATGWTVEVAEPAIDNVTTPQTETVYQDSPELAVGEERQVETAQEGFEATVVRRVVDSDGAEVRVDEMTSTYGPAVNRVLRGTGGA